MHTTRPVSGTTHMCPAAAAMCRSPAAPRGWAHATSTVAATASATRQAVDTLLLCTHLALVPPPAPGRRVAAGRCACHPHPPPSPARCCRVIPPPRWPCPLRHATSSAYASAPSLLASGTWTRCVPTLLVGSNVWLARPVATVPPPLQRRRSDRRPRHSRRLAASAGCGIRHTPVTHSG